VRLLLSSTLSGEVAAGKIPNAEFAEDAECTERKKMTTNMSRIGLAFQAKDYLEHILEGWCDAGRSREEKTEDKR
jgi:hypothetical protein